MLNNNTSMDADVKSPELDPPSPLCCRGSGQVMLPSIPVDILTPAQDCKPSSSPFQHRQFPPPSLTGVPFEYIIDQLHNLAPQYWDKPETADCTIIVPIPHAGLSPDASEKSPFPSGIEPPVASSNRRATAPALNDTPRMSLKLHMDFLSAHSSYLRGLFSGACPLDLMYTASLPSTTSHPLFANTPIPANRLPRLMPCSPDHPIIFLPIPDPTSFHLLTHWMYFGDTSYIADCLCKGIIQWEGIARNVEYLGLSPEIKLFLQDWYNKWLDPDREILTCDSDSDTACSDYEGDDDSSTESDLDDRIDSEDEKEPIRGRTRATRPISFQSLEGITPLEG